MTKRTSSGFSLMELIIVIVLIAIFATVAMTRTRTGLSTIREQIAIDQVTSDIDLVRSMAFGMHETMTIVFSIDQDSYSIYKGANNTYTLVVEGQCPNEYQCKYDPHGKEPNIDSVVDSLNDSFKK